MTFDQTQLEILLDVAIDATRQVGGAMQVVDQQVKDLLEASEAFVQARTQAAARASFGALLQKVPTQKKNILSALNIFKYMMNISYIYMDIFYKCSLYIFSLQ